MSQLDILLVGSRSLSLGFVKLLIDAGIKDFHFTVMLEDTSPLGASTSRRASTKRRRRFTLNKPRAAALNTLASTEFELDDKAYQPFLTVIRELKDLKSAIVKRQPDLVMFTSTRQFLSSERGETVKNEIFKATSKCPTWIHFASYPDPDCLKGGGRPSKLSRWTCVPLFNIIGEANKGSFQVNAWYGKSHPAYFAQEDLRIHIPEALLKLFEIAERHGINLHTTPSENLAARPLTSLPLRALLVSLQTDYRLRRWLVPFYLRLEHDSWLRKNKFVAEMDEKDMLTEQAELNKSLFAAVKELQSVGAKSVQRFAFTESQTSEILKAIESQLFGETSPSNPATQAVTTGFKKMETYRTKELVAELRDELTYGVNLGATDKIEMPACESLVRSTNINDSLRSPSIWK